MSEKKVLFVIGTRPEAIKIAPLYAAMSQDARYKPLICLTGQHPQMAEEMLSFFNIRADYRINFERVSYSLTEFTSACLREVGSVIEKVLPDLVFVHGDTASTFCGAMAAYYQKVPVAHLEAGLRTGDKFSPFPEEMMRKMTGCLADYHFAPTDRAREALLRESVPDVRIWVVGNTVVDALMSTVRRLQDDEGLSNRVYEDLLSSGLPAGFEDKFILITGHRRENFGDGFKRICDAIRLCAEKYPDYKFIYPVHMNPNVREAVINVLNEVNNVYLIDPVNYAHFVFLMENCRFILTDSGGIQEEAPSLGKPVLVMRDTTERPEAIEHNFARLVGTDRIVESVCELIENQSIYDEMADGVNPYGDGRTSEKIMSILHQALRR